MNSNSLYERAKKVMPGGVNSPVRAFGAVGGKSLFYKQGKVQKYPMLTVMNI